MLPVSVLARAKMKIAFGQLPARPCSSSVLVLEEPNWRISSVSASGAARVMGEAAARLASMERVRNFILTDVGREDWLELADTNLKMAGQRTSWSSCTYTYCSPAWSVISPARSRAGLGCHASVLENKVSMHRHPLEIVWMT